MRAFALVAVMLWSAAAAAQGPSSTQDPQPVDPYGPAPAPTTKPDAPATKPDAPVTGPERAPSDTTTGSDSSATSSDVPTKTSGEPTKTSGEPTKTSGEPTKTSGDSDATERPVVAPPPPVAAEPAKPGPLSLDDVPVACAAQVKAAKAATAAAVTAKVTVAQCTANQKLSGLQLIDAEASVRDVEQAIGPSLALLEMVIDTNDPAKQILAYHAGGDLLLTAVTRMRATVPAGDLHDMRAQMLEPLLKPWLERAQTAFAQVDKLAQQHPELLKNAVVANAVRDSRGRQVR